MFPLATQLLSWYSKIVPTDCYVPSSDLSGFRSMTWNIKLCLLLLSFHISFEQKIFRENCSDAIDTTSLPPLQSVPCSVRWLMQVKSGRYNSFLLKACYLMLFVPMTGHQIPRKKFDNIFSRILFVSSDFVLKQYFFPRTFLPQGQFHLLWRPNQLAGGSALSRETSTHAGIWLFTVLPSQRGGKLSIRLSICYCYWWIAWLAWMDSTVDHLFTGHKPNQTKPHHTTPHHTKQKPKPKPKPNQTKPSTRQKRDQVVGDYQSGDGPITTFEYWGMRWKEPNKFKKVHHKVKLWWKWLKSWWTVKRWPRPTETPADSWRFCWSYMPLLLNKENGKQSTISWSCAVIIRLMVQKSD